MSRASSPAAHWSNLDAWLSAMTTGCLPKDTGDPKSLTRQELDADVDQLMSNDPTQTYSSKEWSRIIGSLAHNLVAQARLAEEDNANLEKEIAGLKTQLKEARKQKDNAQEHLDHYFWRLKPRTKHAQNYKRKWKDCKRPWRICARTQTIECSRSNVPRRNSRTDCGVATLC